MAKLRIAPIQHDVVLVRHAIANYRAHVDQRGDGVAVSVAVPLDDDREPRLHYIAPISRAVRTEISCIDVDRVHFGDGVDCAVP